MDLADLLKAHLDGKHASVPAGLSYPCRRELDVVGDDEG
jgi:hypothetical protein